jgi:hypothetical protein
MTMVANSSVDSRAYAFVYRIRGAQDVPADFSLQADFRNLRSGVFLPQDQAGWLSKPRYPARVLLLFSDCIVIASHLSAAESEIRLPLGEVLAIESSKMLLDGRVTFHVPGSRYTCRYNTRDARHVDDFLFYLREALLREKTSSSTGLCCFGDSLDLKFATAESRELDGREQLLLRFFTLPEHSVGKHWVFRREHWKPGDYIGVTTRRLLWISDGDNGTRDPYGTVSRYAPLSRLVSTIVNRHEPGCELVMVIGNDLLWRVPVPADLHGEVESFAGKLWRIHLDMH